jgi:hypothetical protein
VIGAWRAAGRLALAALSTVAIGASGLACPARQLDVQVTSDGADTLIFACESFRDACSAPGACHHNRILCDQSTCAIKNECKIAGNPEWAPEHTMGMRLMLITATADAIAIRKASPCVPLNLRPCIEDPTGLFGCANASGDANVCITAAVAEAVQGALGNGLSFDGFKSPDDVALVAAFFRKPGDEASCDATVLVRPDDCGTENMVAVAGLAAPIGSTAFDITCASCQGTTHGSLGPDNAPCPVTDDLCFLQRIAAALAGSGL